MRRGVEAHGWRGGAAPAEVAGPTEAGRRGAVGCWMMIGAEADWRSAGACLIWRWEVGSEQRRAEAEAERLAAWGVAALGRWRAEAERVTGGLAVGLEWGRNLLLAQLGLGVGETGERKIRNNLYHFVQYNFVKHSGITARLNCN
ncbi:uncharacterized protein A4U43_C04F23420 [Asparagus officinalis]|uniref:Uncharacterized protein n=1 Tax=Asparagus officinalis TaxID=4686 RepID=A0A5P1F363_ASPOF|nr:uncharacterized protein A4U43_C04F23420 [Asparagus officinalis]